MTSGGKEKNRKGEKSATDFSDNFVIVIGRQFGSGGRTIGKLIARKLGIEYYDTTLLQKACESMGIAPHIFKPMEEKKPSVLKSILQGAYGIADNFHTVPLCEERIYSAQSKLIKEAAQKGSCVIVGRNADFVLRNHPKLLSVFLHSPIEKRIEMIISRNEAVTKAAALEMATKNDKRRESFYNFYTGEKLWGVASNYHLTLDTSKTDAERAADMIINFAGQLNLIPQ